MERRIITTDVLEEDVKIEGSLRPQHLDDYIGQEKTKKERFGCTSSKNAANQVVFMDYPIRNHFRESPKRCPCTAVPGDRRRR